MPLPHDYPERVYAGVLGKIIGVYLGRPFEGWTYERITRELGEIRYYVNDRLGLPLVLTDDDLSGTFTFLRALEDYGKDVTSEQIGRTWLNYVVEGRTTLWWGGLGNSTEHTAYLRLKSGIPAPASGSAGTNGRVVAEQIGAQIFVDGWGMVCPGDPEGAAELARRAASVSHDGEAVFAAQVIAAMEAHAFVEPDLQRLLDHAVSLIPRDSVIYRLIADVREWHEGESEWRVTREKIAARYGYDRYPGNCHVVPNHALVILALLYGEGDFGRSLTIANTSGWDTDCNSGNVGCILGIRGGLAGIDAEWREPVRDRLYVVSADGGRAITDAAQEAYRIVSLGWMLSGEEPARPKGGARFHFELPGSVQGFLPEDGSSAENVEGHSQDGDRALALRSDTGTARAATATFIPPDALAMPGYALIASPTLYSGQVLRARVGADPRANGDTLCRPFLRAYGGDPLDTLYGPEVALSPGRGEILEWRVPDTGGQPIAQIGVEARSEGGAVRAYLDWLTWDGAPETRLGRPLSGGAAWFRAWVDGADRFEEGADYPYRLVQHQGRGLIIQGTREWRDYTVSATVSVQAARAAGIAARVQGLRRYYALLLCPGVVRLVKALDGEVVLAESELAWEPDAPRELSLQVRGSRIAAWVGGRRLFEVEDADRPLEAGAIAYACEEVTAYFGAANIGSAS